MINQRTLTKAFAPATTANVAVGFDVLGFALEGIGDEVILTKSEDNALEIVSILGADAIPLDPELNSATVAMKVMMEALGLRQGFKIHLKKSIPVGSGLGGSAASSVAAVTALNGFLSEPLTPKELMPFALAGEEVATDSIHGDNVAPCLLGGMVLIHTMEPLDVIHLPLLPLEVVLLRPHLRIDTKHARLLLPSSVNLASTTQQNAHMGAFISALYEKNYERLKKSCSDIVIEPIRAHMIPHFYAMKDAAYQQGALGCSISGSGPTLFAFAKTRADAQNIVSHMSDVLKKQGIQSDALITTISKQGAYIIDEE